MTARIDLSAITMTFDSEPQIVNATSKRLLLVERVNVFTLNITSQLTPSIRARYRRYYHQMSGVAISGLIERKLGIEVVASSSECDT